MGLSEGISSSLFSGGYYQLAWGEIHGNYLNEIIEKYLFKRWSVTWKPDVLQWSEWIVCLEIPLKDLIEALQVSPVDY